jgi:hypothetical protein
VTTLYFNDLVLYCLTDPWSLPPFTKLVSILCPFPIYSLPHSHIFCAHSLFILCPFPVFSLPIPHSSLLLCQLQDRCGQLPLPPDRAPWFRQRQGEGSHHPPPITYRCKWRCRIDVCVKTNIEISPSHRASRECVAPSDD